MKKLYVLLISLFVLGSTAPVSAMSFYQSTTDPNTWFIEGESCQEMTRLAEVFDNDPETKPTVQADSSDTPPTFSEQDFPVAQSKLIAFVRDVNWKTGMNLTLRDATFFQRLKIVCTGINDYTKPFRMQFSQYDPDMDEHLEELENAAIDALEEAVTDATFNQAAKLSIRGVYNAIITDKPFLLLIIDEHTYQQILELDPQVEELANSMYKFFAYRAIYMGEEYSQNTTSLIKASKHGKGDAIHTWSMMAAFAEQMYELDQDSQLTPEKEKSNHIWRLRATMAKIRHHVKVEKRAVEIALRNPNYQEWLNTQNATNPKKPTLDQEAEKLLQESTEDEIKALISKHAGQ